MAGDVPHGWTRLRLGDAINLKRGYDLPKRRRRAGGVPIVSSAGPSGFHDEAKASSPGVITGRYGTIGEVFLVHEDYWPLNTALYVEDFKGNEPAYIASLLKTINWRAYDGKSGVPGINRNDVHEELVALPDPPEQRAIADVLGALGAKIESNRRLADHCDASWLCHGSHALREAETVSVQELLDDGILVVNDGYRAKNSELAAEGIAFVRARNLTDHGLDLTGADRVPSDLAARVGHKRSRTWDTAFTSKGTVGRITLVDPDAQTFVYSPQVCFWRSLDAERLSPFVLHAWMRGGRFSAQIDAVKGQTDMADYVSLRDQRAMQFDLPSPTVQRTVAAFAEPLALAASAARKETRTLSAVRDALLPKLVSGQIRIPISDHVEEGVGAAIGALA